MFAIRPDPVPSLIELDRAITSRRDYAARLEWRSQSETLETSQSETLETSQSETPETSQSETHETSQSETPETSQFETPETSQFETPETSQPETPETSQFAGDRNLDNLSSIKGVLGEAVRWLVSNPNAMNWSVRKIAEASGMSVSTIHRAKHILMRLA